MFKNGVVDHKIKELCRIYVSRSVLCEFCGNQRSIKAAKSGLKEDDYSDLINFESSTRYDERQKAALAYAEAITWDLPAGDELWDRLHKHFSEPELVEIGYFVAITMGQQRWLRTLNIEHHQIMSSDPRLKAAVAHWGPRFVANGVVLTDFEEVTSSIASYDEWCGAWSKRAAHHEQLGREALAKKRLLTAGECLQRAGVYYHFASFLFVHDPAQMKAAHKKQIECRQAALPYLRPPGERVEIPYQSKTLAGILRKPAGVDKPPVLVMAVGLDSTKEEGDAYETPFLARGVATLIFEGPGQGEAQYDFAIRGDYEVPVKAVLDFVEKRGDLDAKRIGMAPTSVVLSTIRPRAIAAARPEPAPTATVNIAR